jgi:hypothetical protein
MFAVNGLLDDLTTLATWRTRHGTGALGHAFSRQAIPMTWDKQYLSQAQDQPDSRAGSGIVAVAGSGRMNPSVSGAPKSVKAAWHEVPGKQ